MTRRHTRAANSSAVECFKGSIAQSSSGIEKNEESSQTISTFFLLRVIARASARHGHKKRSFSCSQTLLVAFFTSPKSKT